MTDESTPAVAGTEQTAAPDLTVNISIPHSSLGEGQDDRIIPIDCASIPADLRLELLKSQVKTLVLNRVNVANVRRNAEIKVFDDYDAAIKADPMQTAVAKPTGERPAPLDTYGKAEEAVKALLAGELRANKPKGEGRSRKAADPLVTAVTGVVVRAVFEANKGSQVDDGKGGKRNYTYPDATKAVGGNGIAYLNTQIDAKVAAGADRAALEKARDARYIDPAKVMLGIDLNKKQTDLPSIL